MPFVSHLTIDHLRILGQVQLQLSPGANIVVGQNASGKTSILEALHILGRGRSFRESQWRAVIQEGQERLRVVGSIVAGQRTLNMGVERDREQSTVKIAGEVQRGIKGLLEWLPLQLAHSDSHRLIEQGPAYRRQYLDWGVFHVEHRFYPAWQRYRRALKQRNAALRERAVETLLEPWEYELSEAAAEIDEYRRNYVDRLETHLVNVGEALLHGHHLTLRYQRGWRDSDLATVLRRGRDGDRQQGYTRTGPHRADLELFIDEHRAAQRVSRGQQKLLVFALILAQLQMLKETREQCAVLLADDIGAELDSEHLERVWEALSKCGSQLVVTGTDLDHRLSPVPSRDALFHVEHGVVSRVL